MKTTLYSTLFCFWFLAIVGTGFAFPQDGSQTRSVTSEAFSRKRPARSSGTNGGPVAKKKAPSYGYLRSYKHLSLRKGVPPPVKPSNLPKSIARIGVTIWKLRPPVGNEPGFYFVVSDDNNKEQRLIAERVGVDSVFRTQDMLRFAVESDNTGYLYMIGRETYSDGSYGVPYAIFPGSASDENTILPGMLFDYPDQRDDPPFLTLEPNKPNYTGELMTVIVSPKPLTIMRMEKDNHHIKDSKELQDLESGADVEVFSRTDPDDKVYSKTESETACGAKTRDLLKKKSGRSCGQLYNDDPQPQAIYHVKVSPGQPAVAFIKLTVR